LASVVKFVAERRLAFGDDENVQTFRKFFQQNSQNFFKQNFKKQEAAMLLMTDFTTVSQITNHCQILFAS